MVHVEPPQYTFDDAVRIRREAKALQPQVGRIVTEARAAGRRATEIAYELGMVESRVHQILRAHRATGTSR
ncbi:hypothetical protein [Streptomyces fractus]|uniref:hypothetical protein n=1 Tax=Streptomyces fractus TaxID=641806 RepID=UPI003CEF5A66